MICKDIIIEATTIIKKILPLNLQNKTSAAKAAIVIGIIVDGIVITVNCKTTYLSFQ